MAVAERLIQVLHGMDVAPVEFERGIDVPRADLERLVGQYRWLPGVELDITLPGDALYARLTDQPAFRLFARSPTEFFYRVVEASVTFELEGERVKRLVLHQNGRDMPYRRVDKK